MPKGISLLATACPILPRPTIPTVLWCRLGPHSHIGFHVPHSPDFTASIPETWWISYIHSRPTHYNYWRIFLKWISRWMDCNIGSEGCFTTLGEFPKVVFMPCLFHRWKQILNMACHKSGNQINDRCNHLQKQIHEHKHDLIIFTLFMKILWYQWWMISG